ncbi:MAG: hypothetical protein ACFB16_04500 [Phormidesmis sp.]
MTQLDSAALNARNTLVVMFVALCILDTILIIIARDAWAIARIILIIVLMHFVVQGRKWAKWVLIGMLSLQIVALLALLIALSSELSAVLTIGSVSMIILTIAIIVYLIRNRALSRYLSHQQQRRI